MTTPTRAVPAPGGTSPDRTARRLAALRRELAREMRAQRQRWRYHLTRGRIEFEDDIRELHARLRESVPAYLVGANVWSLLTAPVIYSLVVPFVLLDLWVSVYQRICFPVYGIDLVPRRVYFRLDRHKLQYLNAIEKAHCTYCTYANGLLAYVREVAARTEQYWCPIKHARPVPAPHGRYHHFFDYGDAASYRQKLAWQRQRLTRVPRPTTARPYRHGRRTRDRAGG